MQIFEFRRWMVASPQGARYLVLTLLVLVLSAAGMWLAFSRHNNSLPTVGASEESCSTDTGERRIGYARTILLCTMESPKCKPDQTRVFQAGPPGAWNTEAMLIPNIPEGYVITGGDLVDPSIYRIRNMGFESVRISRYNNSSDYCTQHYWYYFHAMWTSSDPTDQVSVKACIYYGKWQGAQPTDACPEPTSGSSP
jgi:hypothetical protein